MAMATAAPSLDPNERFREACENLRKNAAKIIEGDLESSESSTEEEEIEGAECLNLIEKACSKYKDEEGQGLRKIREVLQEVLKSGGVNCLICLENVKRNSQIWSCSSCYCIFHFHCIQKWAKDSIYHCKVISGRELTLLLNWCCPQCRQSYLPAEKPTKYLCFCGKVENPTSDSWTIPHGCGQYCEKKLKPECGHTCSVLCHPGPCPPCPQTVMVSCCCSKSKKISRRCSDKEWTCGKICKKQLACRIHKCDSTCHKGECPPCSKESRQTCLCGGLETIRPCSRQTWRCQTACDKTLKCNNHICKIVCHRPPCPECPNSGPRPCPCGKKVSFVSCTEDVEPCGDTCNKLLDCELHRCSQRCHYGPCETCLQMRVMKCRCGQREKSVPCCKEYICEIKCKNRRDCGRHNCNRKCCTGECPPCEAVCGKTLNCGRHKCSSICHPGPCYPCREIYEATCNCGSTIVAVPCGRQNADSAPPKCLMTCMKKSNCHHKERQRHKCHFGPCPPCELPCHKKLSCGHRCLLKCHSAVVQKIEIKAKPEGQWDLRDTHRIAVVSKPCPPCIVPIPITCSGYHETTEAPCGLSRVTSCGRICGRMLACGNHECNLECHSVEDLEDNDVTKLSKNCETCDQPCLKPRKANCSHPCPQPCHPGPCKPCKLHLKFKCHCEIQTLYINCDEWNSADEKGKSALLICSNRCPKEISCGHRCALICHPGSCSTEDVCKKKVTVRCPCKRLKKEVQCNSLKNKTVQCDVECLAIQEAKKAEELERARKREEEENILQEKEREELARRLEGKKKKRKRMSVEVPQNNSYKKTVLYIFSGVAVLMAVFSAFYLQISF